MGRLKRSSLFARGRTALGLVIALSLIAMLAWVLSSDLAAHREASAGLETGLSDTQPALNVPRVGTNVALEQYSAADLQLSLDEVKAIGFGTVRQRFPWSEIEPAPGEYDWARWDRIVDAVHDADLQLIAVVDTSPAWARPAGEADDIWAPPTDPADYAAFLRALAIRYGERIAAYQIWDQPNIAPHWGAGEIDPAGYVDLLADASRALRAAAPGAVIIAGGLAPNTESGGLNMSDVTYLREIYRRGAGQHFDVPGGLCPGILDRSRRPPRGRQHPQLFPASSSCAARWCVAATPANQCGPSTPVGAPCPRIGPDSPRRRAAIEPWCRANAWPVPTRGWSKSGPGWGWCA